MRMHIASLLLILTSAGLSHAAPLDLYVPDDATLVVNFNVRQLLDARLTQQLFPQGLQGLLEDVPGVRDVAQTFGLNPTRDVATLLYAGPALPTAERGLLVLRGKFELPRLHAAAKAWGEKHPERLQITRNGDVIVYQWRDSPLAFGCLLDETTLVLAATRSQIDDCLARKAGKQTARVRPELKELVEKCDARASVWLAALATDEVKKALATSPETEKLFASLVSFHGRMTVDDGFQVQGVLATKDGKSAGDLRHFVDGIKAILSLAAADSKDAAPLRAGVVAALKVMSAGPAVLIQGGLTKEQVAKLRDSAGGSR